MSDFEVDLAKLQMLSTRLDESGATMTGALDAMRGAQAAQLGDPDLQRACEEFRESWDHGLGKTAECVKVVREKIDQTRESYAAVEQALVDLISGLADRTGLG